MKIDWKKVKSGEIVMYVDTFGIQKNTYICEWNGKHIVGYFHPDNDVPVLKLLNDDGTVVKDVYSEVDVIFKSSEYFDYRTAKDGTPVKLRSAYEDYGVRLVTIWSWDVCDCDDWCIVGLIRYESGEESVGCWNSDGKFKPLNDNESWYEFDLIMA